MSFNLLGAVGDLAEMRILLYLEYLTGLVCFRLGLMGYAKSKRVWNSTGIQTVKNDLDVSVTF